MDKCRYGLFKINYMEYYLVEYLGKPVGESGECCKTAYDLNTACTTCGTGAKVIGNLRVKGLSNIKKDFFVTLDGDYIISQALNDLLIKEKIKIPNLKNVIDYRNRILPFVNFIPDYFFPKAYLIKGMTIDAQCPICQRNGYFDKVAIGDIDKGIKTQTYKRIFHYAHVESELLSKSEIFNTWECLGLSNLTQYDKYVIRYARPLLIIDDKVRNIFEKYSIGDLEYEPIVFINE